MPTSVGARLRYQLDRESERYKAVYRQRTATERINRQAVDGYHDLIASDYQQMPPSFDMLREHRRESVSR